MQGHDNNILYNINVKTCANILQADISKFRFKLAPILWDAKSNTKKGSRKPQQENYYIGSPSDVQIVDNPTEVQEPSNTTPHQTISDITQATLSNGVRSPNTQELWCALSNYIKSIDNAEYLE